jgi:hypothetical protein
MARWSTLLMIAAFASVSLGGPRAIADIYDAFPAWGWRWIEAVDPITDEAKWAAKLTAIGADAEVSLQCVGGRAGILFIWGDRVATKKNWEIEYRFEGQRGHSLKAEWINSRHFAALEPAEVQTFFAEAKVSKKLYVRVTSHAYGVSDASFLTGGSEAMASRFRAVCPVVTGK